MQKRRSREVTMDETCVCGTPLCCCCSYLSPSVNTTVTKCPFLAYSFANAVNCVPIPPLFVGPSNSHVINAIFNVPRGGLVNFVRSSRAFASCSDADIEGNPIVNDDASPPPSVFNACTTSEHKTTTTIRYITRQQTIPQFMTNEINPPKPRTRDTTILFSYETRPEA